MSSLSILFIAAPLGNVSTMNPLVRLVCFLIFIHGNLNALTATGTSVTGKCVNQISKKCVIQSIVVNDPSDAVLLPDLSGKTSLQIKRGNISVFSEGLSKQLGDVKKLHLGQLGLRELHLAPELLDVTASGNSIGTVRFTLEVQYNTEVLKLNENKLTNLDGFGVLKNLKELYLQSNLLEALPMAVFTEMTSLRKLDLAQNLITQITTTGPITLPYLDYLSLEGNRLTTLLVSEWNFESLLELDVSSNDLIRVEGLQDHFGSLQQVAVSGNSWHCGWLSGALENLQSNYVTIKDSDTDCEGLSPFNICCLHAEDDGKNTFEESFQKLKSLEEEQSRIQKQFEERISSTQKGLQNKLTDLVSRVELLQAAASEDARSGDPVTETSVMNDFNSFRDNLDGLKQTVAQESKKILEDKEKNNQAQRQLQYKIMELKIVVERESQKISEVQRQFDLLKDYVRGKMEKRLSYD